MEAFLTQIVEGKKIELCIDTNIYEKNIILKSAFCFLDKGFFLFKSDTQGNIILQLTIRSTTKESIDEIVANFADTLLETYLRDKLEKDNKVIRETIVEKAINGPLDYNNFVTLDTDSIAQSNENQEKNQIDFDKDIDDILKEIENDPDLKIDQDEIEKILREIEEESALEKPKVTVDFDGIQKAKDKFKK